MKFMEINVGLIIIIPWGVAWSEDAFNFNSAHLHNATHIDLQKFKYGNPMNVGKYRSKLYLNGLYASEVEFELQKVGEKIEPCITPVLFRVMRLKDKTWPEKASCLQLSQINAGISWHYDVGENALNLTIPQALQKPKYRGEINPESIDVGVPAAVLRYQANSYQSINHGDSHNYSYVGLDGSFRAYGWRFYHQSSYQANDNDTQWDNISTYAEKSLFDLSSTLRLGQGWTDGTFFDSVSFVGARVATDKRMLPGSRRGFAPTVTGIARTNARVTVTQNGSLLYEASVPPGKFSFADLYPTNSGGDLIVTIHEADGSQDTFTVPYASIPGLVRKEALYYDLSMGYLDDSYISNRPGFGELTLQYGFNDYISGYMGVNGTDGYYSTLVGSALNTYWGALAVDVSRSSWKTVENDWLDGYRWRVSATKSLTSDTRVTLSMSHSNDARYISIRDAASANDHDNYTYREMTKYTANLSQQFGGGSLSFYGIWSENWKHGTYHSYQIGYSNNYKRLGYYIYAQKSQDANHKNNQIVGISFSIPISGNSNIHTRFNYDKNNGNQLQATYTGSRGEKNELSYGLTTSYDMPKEGGHESSIGANGSYRTHYAYLNASASAGKNQQQYSLGTSGALVAHEGGVIATPDIGETFAIVQAPKAAGATVANRIGRPVDNRGYTIIPYLNPFTENWLDLDPQGISDQVEIVSSSTVVVPDSGAAVKVKFATRTGYPWFANVTLSDGNTPPLGAEVFDSKEIAIGAVGQGGLLYARVPDIKGVLHVVWGDNSVQRCQLAYSVNQQTSRNLCK